VSVLLTGTKTINFFSIESPSVGSLAYHAITFVVIKLIGQVQDYYHIFS